MRRGLAVVAVVALAGWSPLRAADPDVAAGNDAYAAGRYTDAIAAYARAAARGAVDPDVLAYDRGTAELAAAASGDASAGPALRQQGLEHLKQATHAADPQVRGAAHYNEGNALLAAGKLEQAIEEYKDALRADPQQEDARVNLEVALRRKQKQGGPPGPGPGQPPPQPQQQPGDGSGSGAGSAGSGAGSSAPPPQGSGAGSSTSPPPPSPGSGAGSSSGSNASPPPKPPPTSGSNAPSQGSGAGSSQPSSGSGAGPGSQASPSPDPNGAPADRDTAHKGKPRHGAHASGGGSPRTPTDRKLDDLEDYSRRAQRDQARRTATGHAPDPEHDW